MNYLNIIVSGVSNGVSSAVIMDLGLVLLFGIVFGRLAEKIKIPEVTGYLVGGLMLGPILGIIDVEILESFTVIGEVALGFIAYQIGNELWFGKLKKSGIKTIIITIIQAVLTTTIVIFALIPFVELPVALVLGAIAAATAPAPIMMIVKRYRTKGELTDTILPVVGLDDAVGVIMFGILLSFGVSLAGFNESASFLGLMMEPLYELLISIFIGSIIGYITGIIIRKMDKNQNRYEKNLIVICISVLLTTGVGLYFGGSPILTPMIAGMFVTNLINKENYDFGEHTISSFIPPLMVAFFTIAGAQLQFSVLAKVGIVGVMYVIGRTIGKVFGTYIGAVVSKSSKVVRKYLGIGLLPQSGVAIGLAVSAYNAFIHINSDYSDIIRNIVLASVLVFELFGPILVKTAFARANEVDKKGLTYKQINNLELT